jgi:hypothetical protein
VGTPLGSVLDPEALRWADLILPLVWHGTTVMRRLHQLHLVGTGATLGSVGRIPPPNETTHAPIAALLGLTHGHASWELPCPRCGGTTQRLVAFQGPRGPAWGCGNCLARWHRGTGRQKGKAAVSVASHTELMLADYACGLRINCTGLLMRRRRDTLLRRLHALHLRQGRSYRDHWLLVVGGQLLRHVPRSPRVSQVSLAMRWGRTKVTKPGGVVLATLGPEIVPAALDTMLHPDAYLRRFAG